MNLRDFPWTSRISHQAAALLNERFSVAPSSMETTMARPFDFSDDVRNQAFFRQFNCSAHYGETLLYLSDHAHHVVPNQLGQAGDTTHHWIREIDNCVILCEPCHERVHENGKYRFGAVASPDDFPYSHGPQA